jgi:AcrR family transcriptional regulator
MALTKKDIAQAALRSLNRVGFDGLTVREIAQELGVKAPALYWHLKNKQELLDEVATEMYRSHIRPLPPISEGDDWVERLAQRAYALRRMMLAYRDGAKVFSGTFFTDETLPRETIVEEIVAAGHTPEQAERVLSTVFSFTVGFTIEQQAVEPQPGKRNQRYEDAILRRGQRGQAFTIAVKSVLLGDFDDQFEQSLTIVLLGVKAWLR